MALLAHQAPRLSWQVKLSFRSVYIPFLAAIHYQRIVVTRGVMCPLVFPYPPDIDLLLTPRRFAFRVPSAGDVPARSRIGPLHRCGKEVRWWSLHLWPISPPQCRNAPRRSLSTRAGRGVRPSPSTLLHAKSVG